MFFVQSETRVDSVRDGFRGDLVRVPEDILKDIQAHIPSDFDRKLDESIRQMGVLQPIDQFSTLQVTCKSLMEGKINCDGLIERISLCAMVNISVELFCEAYTTRFFQSQVKGFAGGAIEVAHSVLRTPFLLDSLKVYGLSMIQPSSDKEAIAFLSRLVKRVNFLQKHQFPAIQAYFGRVWQTVINPERLAQFFEVDHCRNIVVAYHLCDQKKGREDPFLSLPKELFSSKKDAVKVLRNVAAQCFSDWNQRGFLPSEMRPDFLSFENREMAPPLCTLTKLPIALIDLVRPSTMERKWLSLADQHIFSLPKEIGTLELTGVDISGTLLQEFPEHVREIASLRYFVSKNMLYTELSQDCVHFLDSLQGYALDPDVCMERSEKGVESMMSEFSSTSSMSRLDYRRFRVIYKKI